MNRNQAFTILQNAGGIRAARIITENKKKLSKIRTLLIARKLRRGTPVAKIINEKWFFNLKFYTNKHTLDPRPDTETLVTAVLNDTNPTSCPQILDLGTGTGCIICSLIKNIPNANGTAIDKSYRALWVARRNIRNLGLQSKIRTHHRTFDYPDKYQTQFDIIVSNPPYIAPNDPRVDPGAHHDPDMALYAPDNGLAAYQTIAKNAKKWIKKCGKLYLEIGIDMAPDVKKIFTNNDWNFVRSEFDLAGIERVLIFTPSQQNNRTATQ